MESAVRIAESRLNSLMLLNREGFNTGHIDIGGIANLQSRGGISRVGRNFAFIILDSFKLRDEVSNIGRELAGSLGKGSTFTSGELADRRIAVSGSFDILTERNIGEGVIAIGDGQRAVFTNGKSIKNVGTILNSECSLRILKVVQNGHDTQVKMTF